MNITKEMETNIIKYLEKNKIDFWYDNDGLSEEQLEKLLGSQDGIQQIEEEIWDWNDEWRFEQENEMIGTVLEEFNLKMEDLDEYEFTDFVRSYIVFDLNMKQLFWKTGDLNCLIYVYSDYDCCNSFDDPEQPESYLSDVFRRVKAGVKKIDYRYEFFNGAYGGSLFCFVFKTDIEKILELKGLMIGAEYINIPKGTQFGFFSSFQGAGSIFEKRTYRNMKLRINGDTKYDSVGLTVDIEQSYSMDDVYGGINIDSQNITLV